MYSDRGISLANGALGSKSLQSCQIFRKASLMREMLLPWYAFSQFDQGNISLETEFANGTWLYKGLF